MTKLFKPTWLYIKQHSITGLKYFGKTTQADPVKYLGSGKYWKNHISQHGKDKVETIWYCLFYDYDDIKDFAINFSLREDIVNSNDWANLIIEDGISSTGQSGEKNGAFGKPAWNRGISKEPWNKGKKSGQIPWNKNKVGAQQAWNKGKKLTDDQKKNMGARDGRNKGSIPWNKGICLTEEQKERRRETYKRNKAAKAALL